MSGLPEADMNLAAQMLRMQERLDQLEKKNKKRKEENKELKISQAGLKNRMAAQETAKAKYNKLGGEDIFYLDVDDLLPEMLEGAENKEDVEKWAKDVRKTRSKRIDISIGSGAVLGAAGGEGALIVHRILVCGPRASLAAGPAVMVVLIGAASSAALIGVLIGIYKLFRMFKISKEKKRRELDKKVALSF